VNWNEKATRIEWRGSYSSDVFFAHPTLVIEVFLSLSISEINPIMATVKRFDYIHYRSLKCFSLSPNDFSPFHFREEDVFEARRCHGRVGVAWIEVKPEGFDHIEVVGVVG
jgi:hypothetical protein